MYVSYRVVPRVEVVSSGVFRPGVLVIAYDDDVPLNELVCDGANPVGAYDDAMVVAEILALRVRSRVEKSIQQIDIRLPAIQAMLSTDSRDKSSRTSGTGATSRPCHHSIRQALASSHVKTGIEAMEGSLVRGKAFLHWNNGWGEHFKGAVTLVLRTGRGKERIESYQCDQARPERALAQADADQLFILKTTEGIAKRL